MNSEQRASLDELIESARLLGSVQAKKGFGCYTAEDSRFERAMHESIANHRRALEQPASAAGVEGPDVIGADQSPIPAADTRSRWHLRYIDTMVRAGVPGEAAVMCCEGGYDDHDYDSDPEEAARDEMSYWDDDGEAAPKPEAP